MLALLLCLAAGCGKKPQTAHQDGSQPGQPTQLQTIPLRTTGPRQYIQPVGQLPAEFVPIVEKNLFHHIYAFEDTVISSQSVPSEDDGQTLILRLMDLYGSTLGEYSCATNLSYGVQTALSTQDGGFLFVLGFSDRALGDGSWASDDGFASRVIKCDRTGKVQFNTALEGVEGYALQFALEKDGCYYFFGDIQTPETKTKGVVSYTDIFMLKLDAKGVEIDRQVIAGSDFDWVDAAEPVGDHFLLSIRSQSDDGAFAGSNSGGYGVNWVITVDDDLQIVSKELKTGRESLDSRLGQWKGQSIYKSDAVFADFDAGYPTAFLDYGSFYLIVSEHATGTYENMPPMLSSIWCYTETVYSAYDHSGKLLFRWAVDSSPDFDAMARRFFGE